VTRGSRTAVAALAVSVALFGAASGVLSAPARAPVAGLPQAPHTGLASRMDLAAFERGGGHSRPSSSTSTGAPRSGRGSGSTSAMRGDAADPPFASSQGSPLTMATLSSTNWSGYVAGPGPFTAASSTFSVPGLVATPTTAVTAEWVGIDGVNTASLIQAGVQESYNPVTGLVTTQAWWEILPAPETLIPWSQLSVLPGHSVSVQVSQVSGTTWALTVADNTTRQSYTTNQYYAGGQATAEWIVEAPTDAATQTVDTLGDFSPPVAFTNARFTGTQSTLDQWILVQRGVEVAAPSAISSGTFSVAYTGPAPGPVPTPTPTPAATPMPAPTVYTVTAGQPFTLSLTSGSPGLAAQWQVSYDRLSWAPLASVTLDGSGSSSYTFTPTQTAFYQTWYPTLSRYGSWIIEVIVAPAASAAPSPTPTPAPTGSVPPTIFTVTAGSSTTISQSGPPSTAFTLQSSSDGVIWTTLAQLVTDASGNASYTFAPGSSAYYRAVFPSGPSAPAYGVVLPAVSSALTITGPRVITWGSSATFTVAMAGGAGSQVRVLASRGSTAWPPVASLVAGASGAAAFSYRPATNLYYRAVFDGAPGLPGASSGLTRTVVRQVALPRYATGGVRSVARGTSLSFPVVIRPDRSDLPAPVATFQLYGWTGSAWALNRTLDVTADASGVATLSVNFKDSGLYYLTAMADPTPYNANSVWTRREEIRVY
jgi:hypothetical protein